MRFSRVTERIQAPRRCNLSMESPDVKQRSRVVTDGIEVTASRGMLRAVGMGDDAWVKPQLGAATWWNEITLCSLSLGRRAQVAK